MHYEHGRIIIFLTMVLPICIMIMDLYLLALILSNSLLFVEIILVNFMYLLRSFFSQTYIIFLDARYPNVVCFCVNFKRADKLFPVIFCCLTKS